MKFDISLRLRHPVADLTTMAAKMQRKPEKLWNHGDRNRTIQGELRDGNRAESYATFPLGTVMGVDLDEAIAGVLPGIVPAADVLREFVRTGGIASLAVGWFVDSETDGARLHPSLLHELVQLNLTLDLYLYLERSGTAESKQG